MVTDPVTSTQSELLYERAQQYLPGGVSAAARHHPGLGRPFYASRGEGGHLWDVDGREYIDLNMSFGAGLLGHGHPAIKAAVQHALDMGILCAFETEYQTEAARKITELVPSAELVRFTNSGTETTWHAVRTARVFSGRWKLVKFEGHFHGFSDVLGYSSWPALDKAGPIDAPNRIPESAGIPASDAESVIVLPWNDAEALDRCLAQHAGEIAAVIMEPINYNSGGILPAPGYLAAVREITRRHDVVLIFDEILSGFRTGPSCVQGWAGVTPDMCTLGKCLGGGTALSAFAGRRDIMEACAPIGRGVHSGTYNAHPIPIIAGSAFLDVVSDQAFWDDQKAKQEFFYPRLREAFRRAGLTVWVQATGARFNMLFGLDHEPKSYRDAARSDRALEARFYGAAIRRGVYFQYSWHHGFSAMHTIADLEQAITAIEAAAASLAPGR